MNVSILTEFLGWCTIFNYGVLAFTSVMLVTDAGSWAKGIHSRLFNIPEDKLDPMYFSFLANYKLAVLIFNLAPYLALKIMA